LKDLNLPKPDKYDTIQLIAFLQQLITYNGFYDDHLEWVGLEKIQIVASMNPATTVGRHPLSTRFTAIVRVSFMFFIFIFVLVVLLLFFEIYYIFAVNYPERENLISILTSYLSAALIGPDGPCRSHATWKLPQNIVKLAQSMVDVYDEVKVISPTPLSFHLFSLPFSTLLSYSLTNSFLE
jgi:dynein heavy chain 2